VELSEKDTTDGPLTAEGEAHVCDPSDVGGVSGIDKVPEMRVVEVEQGLPDPSGSHEPLGVLCHAVGSHEPRDTHTGVLGMGTDAEDASDSLLIHTDHAGSGVAKGVEKCLLRAFTEGGEDFAVICGTKVGGEFEKITLRGFADFQSDFP
jgi:hypothetical protein